MLGAAFSGSVLLAQPATDALGIRPGSLEATAFAGLSAANNGEGGVHLQIENNMPFGGRIGYNFDKHNAAEFSVANPLSFSANYLYHFSEIRRRWVPHATAGVGGSRYALVLGESDGATANANSNLNEAGPERRQTAFTGNFGGGIKYLLSDHFALRFDAQDVVGRYNATFANVPASTGDPTTRVGRTLNDFQFTAGFVFRFGGR
jgi:hypothetical protein